jgi:NNP family nitrate/nitrite transporter-like MFS transporter
MTFGIFGGKSMTLINTSGTLIGKIPAGTETYIHNAGFVWLILLIPLTIAAFFGMNNIKTATVTPDLPSAPKSFAMIIGLLMIAFVTAVAGLYLLLPAPVGLGLLSKWIVLPLVITATVLGMKFLTTGGLKENLNRQYKIFKNNHTWAMTIIYTMTFGSFIGYSAAFALSIKVIFGFSHIMVDGVMTHNLIRPIGGKISDKLGGAIVTQWVSIVMIASALGCAYFMKAAYASATPETVFVPFLVLFIILFAATGVGNGSTFRSIAMIFDAEQAGPVLGWTSAVAAYGAFIIPKVFGEQIKATTPEYALYGFAVFYFVCLVINWWFYTRKNAYIKNP